MPSVLVTGAGRGIGLAITRHMSARGWDVYATARAPTAPSSELGAMPRVHPTRLDITDRESLKGLAAAQLLEESDGVVNNAGIVVNGLVEGLTLDDLSRQLDVNVVAQIGVTQAVLPKIRAAKGRIVFISSVSGLITTPGTGAYCASKYALESLADALRMELPGIPVSLVEPGPIRTDIWGEIPSNMIGWWSNPHRSTGILCAALERHPKTVGSHAEVGGGSGEVVKAVDHALTARRPKSRYLLDTASRAQKILLGLTPTAINDAVLAAATTSK